MLVSTYYDTPSLRSNRERLSFGAQAGPGFYRLLRPKIHSGDVLERRVGRPIPSSGRFLMHRRLASAARYDRDGELRPVFTTTSRERYRNHPVHPLGSRRPLRGEIRASNGDAVADQRNRA